MSQYDQYHLQHTNCLQYEAIVVMIIWKLDLQVPM